MRILFAVAMLAWFALAVARIYAGRDEEASAVDLAAYWTSRIMAVATAACLLAGVP